MELSKPVINIGTLGCVSDGKSTLVYALTGTKTQKHSSERHRNITIKSGYANLKIWKCKECSEHYSSSSDILEYVCKSCDESCDLVNHISLPDLPGHVSLILNTMNSICLMKGALVVVSAAEPIAMKPQLIQHLAKLKLQKIEKIIICFNKLDLISKELAIKRKIELDELLKTLDIKPSIIIPTSLSKGVGLNYVLKYLMELFPPIIDDTTNNNSLFRITRSFDINKPGINWEDVNGGVVGGSLINGKLSIGDEIEIRPGYVSKKDGKFIIQPIITKILSLETDNTKINEITPGGLVAIGIDTDPFYCKSDALSGNVIGRVGQLPNIYSEIEIHYIPMTIFNGNWIPVINDTVFLQTNNISTEAKLIEINDKFKFLLKKPICIENNIVVIVCRKDEGVMKIVGYGDF